MPKYIISLEEFDEQLDREVGLEELVECKDCKYYEEYKSGEYGCWRMILDPAEPTDFCSKGEMADREMSREEAIKRLEEGAPFSELYDSRWEAALALAIKALKDEPMVRCRDCKYYGSNWWISDCHLERWGDGWGNYPPPTVTEDGFCAWGERREDNGVER